MFTLNSHVRDTGDLKFNIMVPFSRFESRSGFINLTSTELSYESPRAIPSFSHHITKVKTFRNPSLWGLGVGGSACQQCTDQRYKT